MHGLTIPVLRRVLPLMAMTALGLAGASDLPGQEVELCRDAHVFLEDEADMAAITEPDTIDDWRTGRMVPGCRVTASGATSLPGRDVVTAFYTDLEQAGWSRTPDPADAPREASLRYRLAGADCLFNYYTDGMLLTEAEEEVDSRIALIPGQERYNFLVLCMPAMDVE